MQPHGPGNQFRKLIFVAPLLVCAERLSDEAIAVNGIAFNGKAGALLFDG